MLTDEEIIKIILDYIKEDRYKIAILINGEWGSGKTFFAKEVLLKEIKKNKDKKKKHFYVSLYGVENISEISSKIYTEILINTISNKTIFKFLNIIKRKHIDIGLKLVLRLISTLGNLNGINIPSIKDFLNIKNCTIIFDDLERTNMDVNKILGFINDLVEHNQVKAILIANEEEIKEKEFYNKVKEKLIENTIKYDPKLNIIYKDIVECYIKNDELKNYLKEKEQQKLILDNFIEEGHYNIRTLIYSLIRYEKIFKILQTFKDNLKYLKMHKLKILDYVVYCSIQIKLKNEIDSKLKNEIGSFNNNKTMNEKEIEEKYLESGRKIIWYKFIDQFFSTGGYLNEEKIKELFLKEIQEEKEIEKYNKKIEETMKLSFYSLENNWWNLDDDDICEKLKLIKKELEENKYHPKAYKGIIIMLLQLKNNKFKVEEEEFINLMERNLESSKSEELYGEVYKKEYFDIIIENTEFRENYNNSIKNLLNIINEKKKKISSKSFFLEEDKWDSQLLETSSKLDNVFLMAKKFLFYANIEKIIGRLKNVQSPKEIYYLIDAIRQVYSFSNLNDYYKSDIDNIELFIKKIKEDMEEISNKIKTREIALTALQKNLEDYLERIKK